MYFYFVPLLKIMELDTKDGLIKEIEMIEPSEQQPNLSYVCTLLLRPIIGASLLLHFNNTQLQ